MSYQILASDVLVLAAGAATITAAAMAAKNSVPFITSLGTEELDDSLCAPLEPIMEEKMEKSFSVVVEQNERDEAEEEGELVQIGTEKPILSLGDIEKKVVTMVTVEEIESPLTPVDEVMTVEVERRFEVDAGVGA
ncbi:hypothetical protein ACLMJK_003030 [Lecanora helva]